eukprot:6243542-Prymnesium_polylepis.1
MFAEIDGAVAAQSKVRQERRRRRILASHVVQACECVRPSPEAVPGRKERQTWNVASRLGQLYVVLNGVVLDVSVRAGVASPNSAAVAARPENWRLAAQHAADTTQ